ncbi:MAG: lysoplasmalogenase [Chitinophagaceae bacterium]
MKKKYSILLFAIILIAELVAVRQQYKMAEYFFKPLIIIWLLAYFILQLSAFRSSLKKWVIAALLFSWMGDVLLMFQEDHPLFFLLGLSAFLAAHIFYILFFHFIRVKENVKSRWYIVVIVALYYFIIKKSLSPYLGEMKLPVSFYAVFISFMFMLALHIVFIKNKIAGGLIMTGALLFVISDSVLAINKFYQPFEMAGIVIMLTYGLAQLFITEGAIRYISSGYKE